MSQTPEIRIRTAVDADVNPDGDYVLYWMIAFRRPHWNYSLQRAVQLARELNKPLVVVEALRSGYPWASDRIHHFVIQGMADNQRWFRRKPVQYYPYLEPEHGAGKGFLKSIAADACAVVSDDFPCFFLPRMIEAARRQVSVRFELIDSNGILPMRAADKVFSRAFDFRRFLQKNLHPFFDEMPEPDPLVGARLKKLDRLPNKITRRWPLADVIEMSDDTESLQQFPIDHSVPPVSTCGGFKAARKRLQSFIQQKLPQYAERRNQPQEDVASGLSPYLHFGPHFRS